MTANIRSRVRCAIYTRKSSEEGLEQSFNSLQAQREACEAYIASQRHEGWHVISRKYDDGGFSGGNINRPAMKQLLEDIAAGLVDTVVVYKVDRLTRSLTDFAKIIEAFDQKGVSFVSVTQQFNTTTSMGRLTLNVLLSFAQFEREVTGERIRDKIAASKKKGMWMGGVVPLGYDLKGRQLVINPKDARIVQEVFAEYLGLGSVAELKRHLDRQGIRTKVHTSANGRKFGGQPYSRGGLYKLLRNEVYIGRIAHRDQSYAGKHLAIVEPETWKKVSALLDNNNQGQRQPGRKTAPSILAGLVFDAAGNRYTPTHAVKNGTRYRYYTSQPIIHKRRKPSYLDRIPAKELEQLVYGRIKTLLESPQELVAACTDLPLAGSDLKQLIDAAEERLRRWPELPLKPASELLLRTIRRVVLHGSEVEVSIDLAALAAVLLQGKSDSSEVESRETNTDSHLFTVSSSFTLTRRRSGELRLVLPGSRIANPERNSALLKAVVMAHHWRERIIAGDIYCKEEIASEANLNASYVGRILRFGVLSPALVRTVMHQPQAFDYSLGKLTKPFPLDWTCQELRLRGKLSL